jgi:hypothetical protein
MIPQSAINVLNGLTGEGLTRLEEAERDATAEQQSGITAIRKLIESGELFPVGCDCNTWDGLSRRCSCGNRRVYWHWEYGGWSPMTY